MKIWMTHKPVVDKKELLTMTFLGIFYFTDIPENLYQSGVRFNIDQSQVHGLSKNLDYPLFKIAGSKVKYFVIIMLKIKF
jgi:hypothetical protein